MEIHVDDVVLEPALIEEFCDGLFTDKYQALEAGFRLGEASLDSTQKIRGPEDICVSMSCPPEEFAFLMELTKGMSMGLESKRWWPWPWEE